MKIVKVTVLFFIVILLRSVMPVSMASSVGSDVDEAEKKLCSTMFRMAIDFIRLSPEERVNKKRLFDLILAENADFEQSGVNIAASRAWTTFYSNIMSILNEPENCISGGALALHLSPGLLPRSVISLYLIVAFQSNHKEMIEALIKAGANFDELKHIANESEDGEWINNLIDAYQRA